MAEAGSDPGIVSLPNWAREPLVHFLALGALVYVALSWGGDPIDPSSRVIAIGGEEQAQIALRFEQTMGRPPTDAELDEAIDRFVRDEVLYREALRLGLDQGDAVVRQRMVAKMDGSASLAAEVAEPDDTTLRAFFDANAQRYAGARAVTFEQRLFTSEDAARAASTSDDPVGQPTSLPGRVSGMPTAEVEVRFGQVFAAALESRDPGPGWQGPIPSGFGWHLMRLEERRVLPADFAAMRERVLNDWRSAESEARKTRAYEVLRSAYRVEIDR